MVLMAGVELPVKAIRQQVSSAVNVVIQARRLSDGRRKVLKITEVTGMESDTVVTQDIFEFVQTGTNANGVVEGHFRATGVRPAFMDRMLAAGLDLDEAMFLPRKLG
jgi:pilus assembly protein CpaF